MRAASSPQIRALFNSHCCLCKVFSQPRLLFKEDEKNDIKEKEHLEDSGNILERGLAQWLVLGWQVTGFQGRELKFK